MSEVRRLIALSDNATPGEWYFSVQPARVGDKLIHGTSKVSVLGDLCLEDQGSEKNLEFIAALVNWFRATYSVPPADPTAPDS